MKAVLVDAICFFLSLKSLPMLDTSHVESECNANKTLNNKKKLNMYVLANFECDFFF